jgi:hypothetical protein
VLEHPLAAFQFTLAYLGTPFCSGTAFDQATVAQVAGAALVTLLLGSLAYLWRWRRDRALLTNSLPWISLTSIALVNAVLTTLGRFDPGLHAAIQSRYVSFAIMLPIGLLFLISLILRHGRARMPASKKSSQATVMFASLVTALALLFVGATIHSLQFWRFSQHELLTGKAALLFLNVLDEPQALARYVHWSHWTLKAWAEGVDHLGYLHPRLVRSSHLREIASESDHEAMGRFDQFVRTPAGDLAASGWAILLEGQRTADSVLLTYEDAEGEPIIFARVDVTHPRADISERLHDKAYHRCGWIKSWRPEEIPAGTRRISAWAFDAEKCRAFPIGSASL